MPYVGIYFTATNPPYSEGQGEEGREAMPLNKLFFFSTNGEQLVAIKDI